MGRSWAQRDAKHLSRIQCAQDGPRSLCYALKDSFSSAVKSEPRGPVCLPAGTWKPGLHSGAAEQGSALTGNFQRCGRCRRDSQSLFKGWSLLGNARYFNVHWSNESVQVLTLGSDTYAISLAALRWSSYMCGEESGVKPRSKQVCSILQRTVWNSCERAHWGSALVREAQHPRPF